MSRPFILHGWHLSGDRQALARRMGPLGGDRLLALQIPRLRRQGLRVAVARG